MSTHYYLRSLFFHLAGNVNTPTWRCQQLFRPFSNAPLFWPIVWKPIWQCPLFSRRRRCRLTATTSSRRDTSGWSTAGSTSTRPTSRGCHQVGNFSFYLINLRNLLPWEVWERESSDQIGNQALLGMNNVAYPESGFETFQGSIEFFRTNTLRLVFLRIKQVFLAPSQH